jgi:hypothetical protein
MHAKGEKGSPTTKTNFLDEGAVTLLGGCTVCGRGEEWSGVNEL